jgi:glycosyltransferase involved in cell wall biosynthesis
VPNGFAKPEKPVARRPMNPPRIGFIGNFAYAPNLEGAWWLVKEVWPLILKKHPQARLRLAGDRSERENWPAGQNIDALGWLPDVAAEMAGWSLAVAPILSGGGTRIKIAEAFGYRCPTVSTSLGAYGYAVKDGEELFLADNAADFAAKCNRILAEPLTGEKLANRAWEKFEASWTWDAQAGRVAAVVNKVLGASQARREEKLAA